jgi:hypothetical protein
MFTEVLVPCDVQSMDNIVGADSGGRRQVSIVEAEDAKSRDLLSGPTLHATVSILLYEGEGLSKTSSIMGLTVWCPFLNP